jgi:tRNA pseudouridine55 synthase
MARRRKGRAVSGWLAVDKPVGPTSSDVVNRVRRAFSAQKAGHAGTLDPMASGLLAIAFGEATKTVPYFADAAKAYRFTVRFGVATDTDDAEGRVTGESPLRPGDAALAAALPRFLGVTMQAPPRYSAVKIAGQRAYALARADADVAPAPRPVRIDALTLIDRPDPDTAVLQMVCGKGTYVRALARDLGAMLGTPAHVTMLRRIWSGPFEATEALPLARIEALAGEDAAALDALLLPLETGLAGLPELRCGEAAADRLRHGNPAPVPAGADDGATAWASQAGHAVAVGVHRAGVLHPTRVFAA